MHIFYIIQIEEFKTKFCGLCISNRLLCCLFTIAGIIFTVASFLQHVYSWVRYSHVFYCRSAILENATLEMQFLAYDIIIFDFGLMHRILGTTECVANYLDGGYMRAVYCLEYAGSLLILAIALCWPTTPIWFLRPALFMQSSYVLGMAILTMATAPKLLEALGGLTDPALNLAFLIFISGLLLSWLFAFILWHYHWGMEAEKNSKKNENRNIEIREYI